MSNDGYMSNSAQGAQGMRSRGGRIYVLTDGETGETTGAASIRSARRAGRPPGGFGAGLSVRAGGGWAGRGGEGGKTRG
jgi:hypothetical protein